MATNIDTILKENRSFPPSSDFQKNAAIHSKAEWDAVLAKAAKDPVGYWTKAAESIHWFKKWDKAFEWNEPFSKWFIGGKTNASYHCLDRHLGTPTENRLAIIWEGEDGTQVRWTYKQLYQEVCQLAGVLEQDLGLKAGDTVAIYLPLVPQAIVAMLACARLGVTHSVIFAGFAANAIRDRVIDADCKAILTTDIGLRRGQVLDLLKIVRAAVKETPGVKNTLVLRRNLRTVLEDQEIDWERALDGKAKEFPAKPLDSEHPLFFLYTSGTTGKPKGIVHSTGGYLTQVHNTAKQVFDLKENDLYWCTADIGWVTGHSYVVYGILGHGVTALLFEGALNYPHPARIWEMVQKHRPTILYTAPTAIRAFMRSGDELPQKYDLSSLRLLGTVGEPINPEAWIWYHTVIGKEKCPIVDTWWQTETGGMMIAPVPGVTATKPGSATRPLPGIIADIVDENGKSCQANQGGYLVIRHPWPGMLRTIHKNPERFKEAYWSKFPGVYFTGDGAHRDQDGYFWIKGRVDDVLNVSGHRLGTMEIESALVSHPAVAEAAVVGKPDELKGQSVVAYVIPKEDADLSDTAKLRDALKAHVALEIGSIARPEEIYLTKTLPKTRSGKIMRRLLKDLAAGKEMSGDTTTLENANLVDLIP